MRLIANEFNVNEQWLKTGEGELFAEDTDAATATLLGHFRFLSPKAQECALKQIMALCDLEHETES